MKRHISIFALLLSAFVAGVARQAVADEVVVISDRSDLSVTDILFDYDSQSSYYWGRNTLPSDLTLSSVPSGYRFRGWYTMAGNDDTRKGEGTSPTKCTRLLTDDQTITAAKISDAATSAYWSERGTGYVVCPQFVKTYRISTAVSPAGAGSVSGDGTVDDGGSVTLEAKANTGYVFSQWSDGSTTNPRTISDIKADATYTAKFARQTFDLTLGVKEGVARIGYRTGSGGGFTYVTEDTIIKADYGSSYDLIAEASGGWSFDGASTKQETLSNITSAKVFNPVPERATYTVTVEPNGGSGGSCPSYTVSTSQQTKTITLPTRTGYSIASSWEVSGATGKTPTVSGNTLTIPAGTYGNLTLTPTWTANECSLTVNPNGGSYEGQAIEQKLQEKLRYDAKNLNAISVATRENYTLSGYYTSSSGGTKIYDGNGHNVQCDYWTAAYPSGTFKGTSDLRVYAIWKPNASTITLDKQGGTGGADTVSVTYDTTVPAITSLPTRTGYAFEGYYTGKNGGGRKYYNANGEGLEKWTSSGTTVLYANWTPNGYKVQYELNGGSTGTDAPSSAKVGTAFRVSTPTRAGYTFTGWNVTGTAANYSTAKWGVASDAASTAIANASALCFNAQYSFVYFLNLTMTQDATVTLKANWKANSYAVTFNGNGGSPSVDFMTATYDSTYGDLATCTRTGYTFAGWYTAASGGTKVESTTKVTITAAQTLYAHWTANSYTVTFDRNGGEDPSVPSVSVTYDSTYGTLATCARTGYTFGGWWTAASGGTKVESTTKVAITAAQTLYAHWTANSYTVTFDRNGGGTPSPTSTSVTYDSTYGTLATCARTGYTFGGWWTAASGGTKVESTTKVALTANQTLYAHWTANSYTVSFNANGGDGSMANQPFTYDVAQDLRANAFTKAGYGFAGWNTKSNGSGTSYADEQNVKNLASDPNATVTLYAQWQAGTYTVTFNANGGTTSTPSKNVTHGSTYGTLPTCTRKGYRLTGWWTAKEGGTQITEMTTVELTAAQTLYAQWEAKKYDLTIDPKGGLFNRSTKPTTFEGALTFDATNMNVIAVSVKEDGTPFLGYYTSGGVKVYDDAGKCVLGETYWDGDWPDGKYVNDGNLTVEARWSEAPRYDIVVEADPAKGAATGGGTFEAGMSVTLTATPSNGYSFAYWQREVSSIVSTDNPYEFTMSSAAAGTYTAVFTGKVYKVTCLAIFGSPSSQEAFPQMGMPWDLPTATREGYDFAGWRTEPMDGGEKIIEGSPVTAEPPKYLYDSWTEKKPTIIYADPSYKNIWITNSVDKGHNITDAEARTITKGWPATRGNKYWIKRWDPALPLTVAGDTTITAVWESYADVLDCPDLEFNVRTNWFADTTPGFYMAGDSCLKLSGTGGDDFVSVKVTEPGEFTFNWKAGSTTTALYVNEPGSGLQPHYVTSIDQWTPVTIQVTAASKETPAEIMFQPSKQEFVSYLALDAVTWTPGVAPQKHTVSVSAGEHGEKVEKDPEKDEYDEGETVTLTATADPGYAFCCWTNDTGFATNANPWTFKVVDDVAYTATFTNCQYVVTLDPNGGTGGETSVLVTYDTDLPKIDVLPHKDDGSSFLGYFDQKTNGTQYYSNEGTGLRKWDKPNAATLYAQWKAPDMFTLTVTDDGHGTATKEPNQSQYVSGSKVALTATANEGYAFEKWSDGSIEIIREVTVMSNVSYAASFTNIPVVVIDPIARALDCEDSGLTFEVTGGWSVFTNESFAQEGPSCLSNKVNSSTLTTTITESGTLTFWWKAKYNNTLNFLCTTNNKLAIQFTMRSQDLEMWRSAELPINASQGDVTLVFRAQNSGSYTALDHFTWTPEGKEPEYADTDTPVTGFSMADGKVGFSFVGDGRTYHLLGTNDLIAPMPWPMVFETNKASGTILFDIPVKADEPKMFYRIRALE